MRRKQLLGTWGAMALLGCADAEGGRGSGALGPDYAAGEACITPSGEACGIVECQDPCDYNSPELRDGSCVVTEAPAQCDDARGVQVTFQTSGGVVSPSGGFFKPQDEQLQAWVHRRWRDLANYTVPSAVATKLKAGGLKIWNYPDGADYNRADFFAGIMTLPDGKTPESLLTDIINDPEAATGNGDFSGWVGWPRSNARKLGDRVDLDIWGPDNGAVGYFRIASDEFCVITLENESVGTHPVSGVRCWGFEPMTINPNWMNEAGCRWSWSKPAYMFYAIGLDSANAVGAGTAGQQAQEGTWVAFIQDLLRQNDARGSASGRWVLYKTTVQSSKLAPGNGVAIVAPGQLNAYKIALPSDGKREAEYCEDPETPLGECAVNEFVCKSGLCIPDDQRCDAIAQCPDRDDEDACDGDGVPDGTGPCPGQWACTDGQCIPLDWRCDGEYTDCAAGEDEAMCTDTGETPDDQPSGACSVSQVACTDGSCIPDDYVCDGWFDCPDNGDEAMCDDPDDTSGPESCGFACDDGSCIPADWECDEIVDCSEGEDESSC